MTDNKYKNAVLDDRALITGLKSINPVWGDLTVRVAGEAFAMPLIDQKTKTFITIVIDQMALNVTGDGILKFQQPYFLKLHIGTTILTICQTEIVTRTAN